MRLEYYENAGDFFELRQEYHHAALRNLREREGIPKPELVDGRWMYMGADGKFTSFATGKIKGRPASEMDASWHTETEFQIPADVKLDLELQDLDRYAQEYEKSEAVSFGEASVPNPDFTVEDLSDESVDAAMQLYIKKGSHD